MHYRGSRRSSGVSLLFIEPDSMRPHEEEEGEGAPACRWLSVARNSEGLTLAHRPPCQLVDHPVPHRSLRTLSLISMHAAHTRLMFFRLSHSSTGRTCVATATAGFLDPPKGWLSRGTGPVRGHLGLYKPNGFACLLSAAAGASSRRRRAAQPRPSASVMCATQGRRALCATRVLLHPPLPPPHPSPP